MSTLPQSAVRHAVLDGRVILYQPEDGYRVAVDTIFLAAAINPRAPARLLELGCGVAGASLSVLQRYRDAGLAGVHVTGLELQSGLCDFARHNALENGLQREFRILSGDILKPPPVLEPVSFDGVFFNPPYDRKGTAQQSPNKIRALANHEQESLLADWITSANKYLKPKGCLTLIHRADRLSEILALLEGKMGAIRILPLHSRGDSPAKRVIVSALKDNRAPLEILPGIALHVEDGAFTLKAHKVLRDAAALEEFVR